MKIGDRVVVTWLGRSYNTAVIIDINWSDNWPITVEYEEGGNKDFWKASHVILEAVFLSPLYQELK